MATVRLYCGSNRSARSSVIDRFICEDAGRALLLVPSRGYASLRNERILLEGGLPGVWGHLAWSFTDFARELLRGECLVIRTLGSVERRLILERCLKKLTAENKISGFTAAPGNAGLITHLLRVIDALKQAAIVPEEFNEKVLKGGGASIMDILVAAAYEAYQDVLRRENRYDVPGMYWAATLQCEGKRPAALGDARAVYLDGFDDFTPSELRLVKALAAHVEELVFGLNLDTSTDRQDVYTVSRATAGRIQQYFDAVSIEVESPSPTRFSEYAAASIFWRNPPEFPSGLVEDLRIVPCSDLNHEVETIGRRVKRLILDEGVAPDQIAVVFRNFAPVADTVRAVFHESGIPCRTTHHPTLLESSLGVFLVQLIEAAAAWEREAVLEVLGARWMAKSARVLAYGRLARAAQIIAGYEEWTGRLEALLLRLERGEGEDIHSLREQVPEAVVLTRECLETLEGLRTAWSALPTRGALPVFARAFEGMLETLGVAESLFREGSPDVIETGARAYAALQGLFGALSTLDNEEEFTLEEFLSCFQQSLRETTYSWPDRGPGVWCGDVSSIRNLTFEHVFFGGLIEGETPQPPPLNAIYAERDIGRLKNAQIVLEGHGDHHNRERLLFHHGLDAARSSLTLTYRMLKENGRESMPSPFLSEIIELFAGRAEAVEAAPQSDSFIPPPQEAVSRRDLYAAAFHRAPELRSEFNEAFSALEAGVKIEEERYSARPFGIYDGVLKDSELVNAAAARYGTEHHFSVAQIEEYLACPFMFFAQRMLRLEAEEAPNEEFDPRIRGTILHAAVQMFHEQYRGKAVVEIPEQEAETAMLDSVRRAFETHDWKSLTAPPAVRAVEQKRMETQLLRYLHIARTQDDAEWKPSHFEVSFGHSRYTSTDALSTGDPYVMDTAAGPILFCGRIDRIDLKEDAARIIDYKSKSIPKPKEIKSGRNVQLFVYAETLEHQLMPSIQCAEAIYLSTGTKTKCEALLRSEKEDAQQNLRQTALASIAQAISGIRAGNFPPVLEDVCTYCGFKHACRKEKTRLEHKIPEANTDSEG